MANESAKLSQRIKELEKTAEATSKALELLQDAIVEDPLWEVTLSDETGVDVTLHMRQRGRPTGAEVLAEFQYQLENGNVNYIDFDEDIYIYVRLINE
jgi:hypothetical protein